RHRHSGCIPQSLRWRVLDPRTGEPQAADPGYVVGGEPAPKATGPSDAIRAPLTMGCSCRTFREKSWASENASSWCARRRRHRKTPAWEAEPSVANRAIFECASLRRPCSCTIQIIWTGKGLAMLERERREDQG